MDTSVMFVKFAVYFYAWI